MELFKKTYDGESIVDVGRDVFEAFDKDFNPPAAAIPQDDHGFQKGEFVVTIEWVPNVVGEGPPERRSRGGNQQAQLVGGPSRPQC